jgi:hypothetical protein
MWPGEVQCVGKFLYLGISDAPTWIDMPAFMTKHLGAFTRGVGMFYLAYQYLKPS